MIVDRIYKLAGFSVAMTTTGTCMVCTVL